MGYIEIALPATGEPGIMISQILMAIDNSSYVGGKVPGILSF